MTSSRIGRPKARLLICSMLISAGIVLAVVGVLRSVTGKAAQKLPALIESIDPVREAVGVPAQSKVFVDLQSGYTGVLIIDGVELRTLSMEEVTGTLQPGQQAPRPTTTVYEPGNATLTFTPVKGAAIEAFTQGSHTATVIYWKQTEGRQTARSYTWTFSVF